MRMNRIVIVVRGGCVVEVMALDPDVEVEVADTDNGLSDPAVAKASEGLSRVNFLRDVQDDE